MLIFKPCIIVLAGISFTGKSTLGKILERQSNCIFLDIDKTRKEISTNEGWLGTEKEREIMLKAYKKNHQKAKDYIVQGKPTILAATYSREIYHQMLKELAYTLHVPLQVFLLILPDEEAEERLQKRLKSGSNSNIRTIESFLEQKNRYLPLKGVEVEEISTDRSPNQLTQHILKILKPLIA